MNVDVVIPTRQKVNSNLIQSIKENIPFNKIIIIPPKDDEGKGIGVARQLGLEKVTTQYHVTVDDDTVEIPKNWYETLLPIISKPGVAVASGRVIFGLGTPFEKYYRSISDNPRYSHSLSLAFMDTSLIKEIGYAPLKSREDDVLYNDLKKHNYRWVICSKIEIFQKRTVSEELNKMKWWAVGAAQLELGMGFLIKKLLVGFRDGVIYGFKDWHLFYLMPLRAIYWIIGYIQFRGKKCEK